MSAIVSDTCASEHALGRRDRIGLARVDLDRHPQRAGQPLEAAFDDMMVVAAVEILDVQGDARRLREALEPVLDQFGIPFAQPLNW
jgi:hypothetical protein